MVSKTDKNGKSITIRLEKIKMGFLIGGKSVNHI